MKKSIKTKKDLVVFLETHKETDMPTPRAVRLLNQMRLSFSEVSHLNGRANDVREVVFSAEELRKGIATELRAPKPEKSKKPLKKVRAASLEGLTKPSQYSDSPAVEGKGVCLCGCGEKVNTGRNFRPGHDARLRGKKKDVDDGKLPSHVIGKAGQKYLDESSRA